MRSPETLKVKICGVANIDDAIFASECGADIVGVILDKNVGRHGTPSLVSEIRKSGIRVAGVYTSLDSVMNGYGDEQLIQLHFTHNPDVVSEVKSKTGRSVISVIQLPFSGNLESEVKARYQAGAEVVLVENRAGIVESIPEMRELQSQVKTALSGRISPENALSLSALNPLMLDLSSSLEEYPGKKDHERIKQLFSNLEVA